MNAEEVKACQKLLRGGAIQQDLDDDHVTQFALHLRPLPYQRTLMAIQRFLAMPGQAGSNGQQRPKFVSSVDELLAACDVNGLARPLVAEAAYRGGEVWPNLREHSGWSLVREGEPTPIGVLEWRVLNGLEVGDQDWTALQEAREAPLPPGARALPPGGKPVPLASKIGDLKLSRPIGVTTLSRPKEIPVDQRELPDPLRDAIDRVNAQHDRLAAEVRAMATIRAEAEDALLGGEVPAVMVKTIAEKLLRRLADDIDEGRIACVEVLAAACFPGLEVRELKQMPDDEDPTTVRIVLKRKPE